MDWQKIVFIVFAVFSAASIVSSVGEPREPLRASVAAGVVVVWALLIALVVSI